VTKKKLRANVYVDGFNLFRGLLKGQPRCKRLDLRALSERMFPAYEIGRIRYFTARVTATPRDPGKSQRQQTYIRALQTLPELHVHYGHFLPKTVTGSLLDSHGKPTWVMETVRTSEEKGSDVNLATYLLLDAFGKHYDTAVVISNDSDLVEPCRRVRQRFGVAVDILNPTLYESLVLKRIASSYRSLKLSDVQSCQLPPVIVHARGTIRKPSSW
jgi:uncharacterized LabA/DUF88 family protein